MPSRVGSKRAVRYLDGRGRRIRDPVVLERIESLAIPPACPDFRAAQEQEKYDSLIRFGERLPELRAAMTEHLNDYVKIYLGEDFIAKDFRTWGGRCSPRSISRSTSSSTAFRSPSPPVSGP
jgi:DNA topoisomerase IB